MDREATAFLLTVCLFLAILYGIPFALMILDQ
jgi:hypothetical protein